MYGPQLRYVRLERISFCMSTNQSEFYRGLERAGQALQRATSASQAALATIVHEAVEPLLSDTAQAKDLACRAGCSHCCHYPVGITFPEAMRLAEAIKQRPGLRNRVQTAATEVGDQAWHELIGQPCPLLVDNSCAIHDDRPMPCRALGSLDKQACEDALTTDRQPPRDEVAWWRGLGASQALATYELPGSRELRSSLSAILSVDDEAAKQAFLAARTAADA